jgi:hypothetical protein
MRKIVFDIETIGELRNGDLSSQEVTVVGIHDSKTDKYTSFVREELHLLWPIFESADSIIGYNSDHFDTKIKSIDILKEIRNVLGRRLKLDNIAEATLGKKKSGNGLEAQDWWVNGEYDRVRDYCLDDVRITKEVYDYARKHKKLKYKDYDGPREIKLDTSHWEKIDEEGPSMTHTLPF